MTTTRKQDQVASIERALDHHGATRMNGVVHSYSAPYTGRPYWMIRMAGIGAKEYTTAQAVAVCDALAAAEAFHGVSESV